MLWTCIWWYTIFPLQTMPLSCMRGHNKNKFPILRLQAPAFSNNDMKIPPFFNKGMVSCSTSEGVQVWIVQLVALEKLVDDREEARCMSLVLGLPQSHWRGAKGFSDTRDMEQCLISRLGDLQCLPSYLYTCVGNGIKWYCTQIWYEMRPSLDGTSSLILWVVWGMNVEVWPKGTGNP